MTEHSHFYHQKTHLGHHCSKDYPKYTNLTALSDLLFHQPMTLPQRTYHPMSTISHNHTWKHFHRSSKTLNISSPRLLNFPNFPEGAFLVTADVVSMYNNIPHREGIIQHIRNNKGLLPENSPRSGIIQTFLDIILTNNHFQYDDMFSHLCPTICFHIHAQNMAQIHRRLLFHIHSWRRQTPGST